MAKLKDDPIKWVLSLDAKGVQSELVTLSSKSKAYEQDNKRLQSELRETEKQMEAAAKAMSRMAAKGDTTSKSYQYAKTSFDQNAEAVKQLTKQIDRNKLAIAENNQKARDLTDALKTEDMTMQQLRKRAKELQLQLDRTAQSTDPAQYKELEAQLKAVRTRMGELKSGTSSMSSVLKGGLMVMTGNLMTKGLGLLKELASAVKAFVQEGIRMAKTAEAITLAFKKLSDSTRILSEMKKATSGTVSELELMKKTLRAHEMGIPIEQMATLMDYAARQAVKLGKDVNTMTDSIVDGINRKSTLILNKFGLSVARIQTQVKKTGDFTQAVMQLITEEIKKAGQISLTSADKAAQAAAKWENAQLKVGKRFLWIGQTWDKVSGYIAENISNLMGETDSLSERYQRQLETVADLEINVETLVKRYDELKKKTNLSKQEQADLSTIMHSLSEKVPGVVSEFGDYGKILSINTEKVYDYIEAEKARLAFMNKELIADLKKQREKLQEEYDKQQFISKNGKYVTTSGGGFGGSYTYLDERAETLQAATDKVTKIGLQLEILDTELNEKEGKTWEQQVKDLRSRIEKREQFYQMNKQQLKAWIDDEKNASDEYIRLAQQTYRQRFGDDTPDPTKAQQQQRDKLNKLNQELETKHREKLAQIRQKYIDGEIKSESAYNRQIFAQEQANYMLREAALKEFLKHTTDLQLKDDINNQIAQLHDNSLTQQIKYQQELEKILLDADPEKKEKARYEHQLRELGIFGTSKQELLIEQLQAETEEEKQLIQQRIDALEILEKQHQDNVYKIREQAKKQKDKQSEDAFENEFSSRREEMQKELNDLMIQAKLNPDSYDAQMAVHIQRIKMINEEIEARKKAGLDTQHLYKRLGNAESQMTSTVQKESSRRIQLCKQYAQSIGTTLGQVITGQEDALRSFADTTIDILFEVLQQIINAEIQKVVATATAAIARTTAEQISTKGFAGIATAAALTAVITGAMAVAKSALKGMLGKNKSVGSGNNSSTTSNKRVVTQGYAQGGYHTSGEGYTGPGDKYEVKGYFDDGQPYHAGEYIIPKWMMPLPNVAPVVRNLETIRRQKNDTPSPGFAQGGIHQSDNTATGVDPQLMKELLTTMQELRDKKLDFNIYEFERKKNTADNARKLASRR